MTLRPGTAKEAGSQVGFYAVEAEKLPDISLKHEIVAVPTVILFRGGKAVDR
jgi:thioredoxin-like negative regulator of GroEL